jgi:hypothetical protein
MEFIGRSRFEVMMNEIQGTYRDGHVELTAPVNWPDGTPVTVQPSLFAGQEQATDKHMLEAVKRDMGPAEETGRKEKFQAAIEETNRTYGEALKRLAQ